MYGRRRCISFFLQFAIVFIFLVNRMANFSLDAGLMGVDIHGKVSLHHNVLQYTDCEWKKKTREYSNYFFLS